MQKIEAKHINYGLIALTAFLIPLYQPLVRYAIGLLVLSTFFNLSTKQFKDDFVKLIPFLFYFVWLSIGLIWTKNSREGMGELEKSLSFVIFPLVFGFSKQNFKKSFNRTFSFFTFGYLAAIVISLIRAIFNFVQTNDLKVFYYGDLSFFHHPTYMAMYGAIVLIYLYMSILDNERMNLPYVKSAAAKFAIIFAVSIYTVLIMSKAGILIMILINLIGILIVFKKWGQLSRSFLIIIGINLIMVGAYFTIKPLQQRVNEVWISLTSEKQTESSTGARILVWDSSWEIIKETPIIGVGTGDLSNQLDDIYRDKGYSKLLEKSLNSHNQFLETWAKNGLIGLISLLSIFTFSFNWKSHIFPAIFTIVMVVNMMMESMLEIQSGIIFMAFFGSLLSVSFSQTTKSHSPSSAHRTS